MRKILATLLLLMLLVGAASATYTVISKVASLDNENDYASAPASWDTLLGNGSVNFYDWPDGYDLILMANVTGIKTTNYLSIIAGDNPPAFRSDIGNLTLSTWTDGGNEVRFIGPLESARFMNATGYLQVSSKNLTGKVAILKVKY
jgi:hypothetical protein